jgi:hypothetical protein
VAERAASEAVRKVGLGRKTQSDFREMGPAEQRTALNRPQMSAAVPHQTRTRPRGPGEPEVDESGYLDDVTGKPSDARSRARRPAVRRARGQEDATSTERVGQDDLGKIAERGLVLKQQQPHLTDAQAFTAAYEGNAGLRKRHYVDRMRKLGFGVGADGRLQVGEHVI